MFDFYANLGKYTSPMDGMGIVSGCFIGIPSEVCFLFKECFFSSLLTRKSLLVLLLELIYLGGTHPIVHCFGPLSAHIWWYGHIIFIKSFGHILSNLPIYLFFQPSTLTKLLSKKCAWLDQKQIQKVLLYMSFFLNMHLIHWTKTWIMILLMEESCNTWNV